MRPTQFVGKAQVVGIGNDEYRMELVGDPGCIQWTEEDVGKDFIVSVSQAESTPDPLCPECGRPASEHRNGLFCCPHCGGEVEIENKQVVCQWCHIGTILYGFTDMAGSVWNRRALGVPANTNSVAGSRRA